jgi:hypothetical protein
MFDPEEVGVISCKAICEHKYMATIILTLTDLTFPANLGDEYCKFRPLISLRYRDSKNRILYAREALPGVGKRDYWECEKDNKKKANYVRHDTEPKVDMKKVDISKREIVFNDLDLKQFDRIEVELFDIDIKSGLEKVVQGIIKMLPAVAARYIDPTGSITFNLIKEALEKGTGKKIDELEQALISKAIGKDDGAARSIWVRSYPLKTPRKKPIVISGPGVRGTYSITLKMEVS